MGSLSLPSSGLVYADTQIVIYSTEKHPVYAAQLRPLWQAASAGTIEIVTSELTFMEALVGPYKSGNKDLIADYEHLFEHAQLRLLPISRTILKQAARLRAQVPGLHTPDAIHISTAMSRGVALFITNDHRLQGIRGLPIAVLGSSQ
jgi:predicted nucleic acid-binding protein